jgi:hypothetical protein
VAAVQYKFTHKQYTEYREWNLHNDNKNWEVRAALAFCELYPGICLTTEEKARKTLRVVEKCPFIPVAVVRYTFTHKQYTQQHNETEYTERNIHKNNENLKRITGNLHEDLCTFMRISCLILRVINERFF